MTLYDLPKQVEINGTVYAIRSDYRVALDVIEVMSDAELDDGERAMLVLTIFYPDFDDMPRSDFQEAVDYMYWFIGGGKESTGKKMPKLMDWSQDFPIIVSPINRVVGTEIRDLKYMHWWTFLSAYQEIGECYFANVVSIRKKRMKGKKLDKADEAFYRENADAINLKTSKTDSERAIIEDWT